MRLIDAELLQNNILEEYGADAGSEDVNIIYGMIVNAPTIEAKPVKHGEWVKKTENLDGTATYECSNCEYEETLEASPIHYNMNYCNCCGADMGLED